MIAMQMRQDDAVDVAEIEPARLERHRRGGAAIDHQRCLRGLEPEAGIEPAAGAEGIAGANDRQPHDQALALGRAETSACQRRTLAQVFRHRELGGLHEIDRDQAGDVGDGVAVAGRERPVRELAVEDAEKIHDARLVGLGPGRHLRHLHLASWPGGCCGTRGRSETADAAQAAGSTSRPRAMLQRPAPEQRRLRIERLEIAADGDRFRDHGAVVEHQRRHPLQRVDGREGRPTCAPARRDRPARAAP